MVRTHKSKLLVALLAICLGFIALQPLQSIVSANGPAHKRALVFVSDGMRQDLMLQYAAEGKMPAYKTLLNKGVEGVNGMIPNVPANTGPSWTSLITGAPSGVTGVTNNTFGDNTKPFSSYGVSAWAAGVNKAQTLAKTADDQGLLVAAMGWQAFDMASVPHGVAVEYYTDWLTGRGIIANYDVPLSWTNVITANATLANTKVTLADATGWTNAPESFSTAKETSFSMANWSYVPVLNYKVYIYDSTNDFVVNYDKVLVAPGKDASLQVADLGAGQWSGSISVTVNDWMGIPNVGGFYLKPIDLTSDLSKFRLFYSEATRVRAVPQSLEDDLATRFGAIMPVDYSPYLLGLIDAQTFVEQNAMAQDIQGSQMYPYVIEKYNPDLVLAGSEWTDGNQHRFLGRCLPGTDVYDPVTAPTYCGYVESAYEGADHMLASLMEAMDGADVFVTSDHGFSLTSKAINANYVLQQAGLFTGNYTTSKAVMYEAGGTAQIYINLVGRNPNGVVAPADYDAVRQQIVDAFNALGSDKIERVLLKEDTAAISTALGQTYNMLNQNTTGDVVVFSKPPYQFDAATPNQVIGNAPIDGQHGFVPNGDLDRFSVFVAGGPDISNVASDPVVVVTDLAPTVAHALGINAPAQSQGNVLDIFKW